MLEGNPVPKSTFHKTRDYECLRCTFVQTVETRLYPAFGNNARRILREVFGWQVTMPGGPSVTLLCPDCKRSRAGEHGPAIRNCHRRGPRRNRAGLQSSEPEGR